MNIKEFKNPPSQHLFWLISGPVCAAMVLLTVIIISWGRPRAVKFRKDLREKLTQSTKTKVEYIENRWQRYKPSRNLIAMVTARDNSRTPSAPRECSTENTTEGPMAKLSSAIKRAVETIAIPKWRGRGNGDVEKTPDHQVLSVV